MLDNVIRLFVAINIVLAVFNMIPVPPLDGSAILFRLVSPATAWQIRPMLAQYGSLLLLVVIFAIVLTPLGNVVIRDHQWPHQPSPGRSKVRQFRGHLRARVRPAERAALAGWLTPGQLALFDGMHVADRRHGLDVVASLRAAGVTDDELLLAGLLHDCAQGTEGGRPAPGGLVARRGLGPVGRLARPASCRGSARPSTGSAITPTCRRPMALEAGCSTRTAELIRHQAAPLEPTAGELLRLADEAN